MTRLISALPAGLALIAGLCLSPARAQQAAPQPRGEIVLGKADAPVTLVEYISFNCPHCRAYHQAVFPAVAKALIDSGRVRYVIRDLPLDEVGMAAAMLARCQPAESPVATIRVMFEDSDRWWTAGRPLAALRTVAARFGMDGAAFEACLKNKAAYDTLRRNRAEALEKGVIVAPTFVVGERRLVGLATLAEIERLVAGQPKAP